MMFYRSLLFQDLCCHRWANIEEVHEGLPSGVSKTSIRTIPNSRPFGKNGRELNETVFTRRISDYQQSLEIANEYCYNICFIHYTFCCTDFGRTRSAWYNSSMFPYLPA
jgi:hypothetical protein